MAEEKLIIAVTDYPVTYGITWKGHIGINVHCPCIRKYLKGENVFIPSSVYDKY